ncbi:hypothetical protein, partial [Escherichia coli]|uniref:hypothetical protein n=1 Tax=Escherichia coli TaxID=562 RepID=UPI00200E1C1B
ALQPDGKFVVVGNFDSVNGQTRQMLARLNPNGALDETFAPPAIGGGGTIFSVVLQDDGKVVIAGNVPGQVARLNADGTLDGTFSPPSIDGGV